MESLLNNIREEYPFVKIWAFESSNRIELQQIEIPFEHRGRGIGSEIIKRLQKYAHSVGKPIVLRPKAERGRKRDLERFYKRLGFVDNKGRNMDYTLSSPMSRTMYWRFKEWLCLAEGLKIIHIDPEEDWEYGDQAYQIAKMVNIRPSRNKNPTIIALNDKEEVIGAAFTAWENDEDASSQAGEPIAQWDFDVVVHPSWQGYEMVGMKLIRQAELERKNLESQYGQKAYTRTWVVNPRLARVLQTPRYGYTADSEYEDGSAHLTKYEGVISASELSDDDYRGMHRAPDREGGSPLYDVTLNGTYPDDFYSPNAVRYYGDGTGFDSSIYLVQSLRGKPNVSVKIYRAIPKTISNQEKINELEKHKAYILKYGRLPRGVSNFSNTSRYYDEINKEIERLKLQPILPESKITINKGDWVTIDRRYAVQHGVSTLLGKYRILSKTVKAKDLYTDGNSIYEWGYDPA